MCATVVISDGIHRNKMSSRAPDLLSNIFVNGLEPLAAALPRSPMKSCGSFEAPGEAFAPPASRRRTAIWDMHRSMHSSIIGTCLSSGEIRRLLIKLGVHGAESAGEHDLHKQGVALAGQAQGGGKFMQKALDRPHEAAIKQFAKAQDENGLRQLWEDALKRGDIPGAYWAVLSHAAATDAIMQKTFGDVHMLLPHGRRREPRRYSPAVPPGAGERGIVGQARTAAAPVARTTS